ncbi:MAG: MMPL family transporter [Pseudomonadota bacterium]
MTDRMVLKASNPTKRLRPLESAMWYWVDGVSRKPLITLAAMGLSALIGLALAANFLGVNSDTSKMVSPELDYRKANLALNDAFPEQEKQIVLVIRGRSPDEAAAFARLMTERLAERTDAVEAVFSPVSDPFFQQNGLLFLDLDELEQLLPRMSEAAPLIRRLGRDPELEDLYAALLLATEAVEPGEPVAEAMARAFSAATNVINARLEGEPEPLSWRAIFQDPDDADALNQQIVIVTPTLDYSRLQPARPAVLAIGELVRELRETEGFEVIADITGDVALRTEELQSVTDGMAVALGLSFLFVSIILMIALRSFVLIVTCLAALVVSISITAGFAAVVFGDLNLVSVAFAVLMIGLGIDFAIHFALSVQEERQSGRKTHRAMARSVRRIGAALALCAPTSALAFFSFAPTQFIGMAQLGIVSGFGVLVAFVVSVTLLPAAFTLLPERQMAEAADQAPKRSLLDAMSQVHSTAVYGVLGLGLVGVALLPQVRFDADPMALRDPEAPSVRAFNLLFDDPDTQPFSLSVLEQDPARIGATKEKLEALPEVRRVISLDDLVPEDQFEKADLIDIAAIGLGLAFSDAEAVGTKGDRSLLPDLLDRLEMFGQQETLMLRGALLDLQAAAQNDPGIIDAVNGDLFAYWPNQYDQLRAQILAAPFEADDLPQTLRDRYLSKDGDYRLQIEPADDLRDEEARARFVDAVRAADPRAAGSARSVLESGRVISQAMLQAIGFAFFAVTLLLWLVLRDGWLVAVILFCLALAGLLTAAGSVLLGMPFNFANIIVLPLLVGVGADSGIHLGLRTVGQGRDANASPELAGKVYETSTPRAVFYSAITTIATFGTLSFSPHQGVASMGALLTVAIACTLLCTVVVLPWLMERALVLRGDRAPVTSQ